MEKGVTKTKGVQKGQREHLFLIAKKLILNGESNEYICDLLDVDEEFIENIRTKL